MDLETDKVTNFYDENKNLLHRIKAKKGTAEHTIVVNFNGKLQTFKLMTRQNERIEIIPKKPHEIVVKFWEDRFQQLNHYIQQQKTRIEEESPSELNHTSNNLFVPKKWGEVVSANLEEVKIALQNLQLRLEKLQFSYLKVD